jgi:hypothetical protein
VTFEELRQQVALFAAAMRKMGVKKGDRVVGKGLSLPPPPLLFLFPPVPSLVSAMMVQSLEPKLKPNQSKPTTK